MSLNLLYVDDLHFLSCSKSTLHPVINCKPCPFIAPFLEFNVVFVYSLLDPTFSQSWKVFLLTTTMSVHRMLLSLLEVTKRLQGIYTNHLKSYTSNFIQHTIAL